MEERVHSRYGGREKCCPETCDAGMLASVNEDIGLEKCEQATWVSGGEGRTILRFPWTIFNSCMCSTPRATSNN